MYSQKLQYIKLRKLTCMLLCCYMFMLVSVIFYIIIKYIIRNWRDDLGGLKEKRSLKVFGTDGTVL